MKKFALLALALVLVVGCGQQQNTPTYETVGEAITVEQATPLNELMNNPQQYVGQTLLLEGHVTGRCAGSGCWVSLDTGEGMDPFYVKSADHSFVFPENCVDHNIRVQGVLMVEQPSTEEMEEHEHAEGEEDHECPAPVYYLNPVGVQVEMPQAQA